MKTYKVGASSYRGTYTAGRYCAESKEDAIEQARRDYANSPLGRELRDVGAFRFFILRDEEEE